MQQFTPLEYILIAIANAYGLDKITWDKRISWSKQLLTSTPHTKECLIKEADEPILMQKALLAYEDAMNGTPTGYIMGLDATASGIQIMAALIGCPTTASKVNLTDTGKREDVYNMVANKMNKEHQTTVDRTLVKKPIMTTYYGSKQQPEEVFGKDTPELYAFYEVLNKELPGAMAAMSIMQSCWQPYAKKHSWKLPDGHVAQVKVIQASDKKIEVEELDKATFTYRTYINEGTDNGISLAANIVHSIDGYVVREMVRRSHKQGFDLLCIHDSFWASPNHMQKVRQNYVDILCEIADMSLLQDILNQITSSNGSLDKATKDLSKCIAEANYALS